MLPLVLADRHSIRLIDEDVCSLQDRVGEQSNSGTRRALFLTLVLELRHASGFAEPGLTFQDPCQLTVFGDLALHENRGLLRI